MVGKTKPTGRWKLRSPRRRTANNLKSSSGDAAEQQQGAELATVQAPTQQEDGPGGTPAPSPRGLSQSQLPPPPRGESMRMERGRSKEHSMHSTSDEFGLSDGDDEPPLSSAGRRVGGRSRSPLLGLRILAKNLSRKGRPREREKSRGGERGGERGGGGGGGGGGGVRSSEQTDSDSMKKTQPGPRGEPVQPKCPPGTVVPRKDLTGSAMDEQNGHHTRAATGVEDVTPATDEPVDAAAGMLSGDHVKGGRAAQNLSDTAKRQQRPQQAPPQIAFIGVFLNGIGVALASYAPQGGADARDLVKSLLLEPGTPVLPGSRYTASGSALAVHMAVDHKNRVYACLVADDVPLSLAFSLLEEMQIDYLSSVSTLAFSTLEHSHNKQCRAQMTRTVAKYEKVETALGQERETRRQLGEGLLDIETSLSEEHKAEKGPEVVRLNLDVARHAAALAATREALVRSSTKHAACAGPLGWSRSFKLVGALVAVIAVIFLAALAARSLNLAV